MKLVHLFYLGCAILVALLVGTGAAIIAVNQKSTDNRRIANDRNAVIVHNRRVAVVVKYSNCLQGNDDKKRVRTFSWETLVIIYGDLDLTPAERAKGEAVKRRGLEIYPDENCTKLKPPHLTKAEKATLFRPKPIPPLILDR